MSSEEILGSKVISDSFLRELTTSEMLAVFGHHYRQYKAKVIDGQIHVAVRHGSGILDAGDGGEDDREQQEKDQMGGSTEKASEAETGGTEKAEISRLIPTVIGRIDPIIDAIRAGDWETARRLTDAETDRLTEIRDKLDQEWRVATGKALAAYRFGEFLKDNGPGVMERLKGECN